MYQVIKLSLYKLSLYIIRESLIEYCKTIKDTINSSYIDRGNITFNSRPVK